MWRDPIVDEVHSARAQLLKNFDGDLDKYVEHVSKRSLKDVKAEVAKKQATRRATTKSRPKAPAPRPKTTRKPATPKARKPRSRRAA